METRPPRISGVSSEGSLGGIGSRSKTCCRMRDGCCLSHRVMFQGEVGVTEYMSLTVFAHGALVQGACSADRHDTS